MISKSMTAACALAAIVLAFSPVRGIAQSELFAERNMRLMLSGQPADHWLQSEANVRDALAEFGIPEPSSGMIGAWVSDIRDARAGASIGNIPGLPGYYDDVFLDAVLATLNGKAGFDRPLTVSVRGQIEEYVECDPAGQAYLCTDPNDVDGVEPGYFFDGYNGVSVNRTGHLWVKVLHTLTNANTGQEIRTIAYRWKVKINHGFHVADRDPDGEDAFPDAEPLSIPQEMAGDFQFKLWAFGETIEIVSVQRSNNYPTVPLTPLPSSHRYYETDEEACVDMMFVNFPPRTLAPGMTPPNYCLGRCVSPPIVNTM